ncbi:hypothetical protein PS044_06705 [Escherichia albertii]|uniref:hypothetical protein n=1 Tax=Escherichia albertii TaxID=208962 RepID=UPI00235FC8E1|nr:hypothetical protein [Escherichia albertii]WDB57923.1 hypothetical protein PS044_06705 [Escherichia albertii]
MKIKITPNTTICIEEQKIRILEFFREYWGIQRINEVITNSVLCVNNKNYRCNISWSNNYININYQCSREMHIQEQNKFVTTFNAALNHPVPEYYTDIHEKSHRTFLRKKHRRGDGHIGCSIYPYKEDLNGGWDYNVASLFIYECDFEILSPAIKSLYPLANGETFLDYTSWNEFTSDECAKIIKQWLVKAQTNTEYAEFIKYVIEWMKPLLNEFKNIMIEGNL